jgi:poly(A) polymerase
MSDTLCFADETIERLAVAFHRADKEFYLVGGTVRDWLLNRECHDIDCCTNALPDEIKQIAATTTPLYIVPIGEKFGTIQLHYVPNIIVEVTTYRGERYLPGSRKPEVQFGTSIYEDLRRRDFTINAIAKNPLTRHYIDVHLGAKDINAGIIRAVEDPTQRFKDDPLRLMRAVRLATQIDFNIALDTQLAIREQAQLIQNVSWERIRNELIKILLSEHAVIGIDLLQDSHLLKYILPEVESLNGVVQPPHHKLDVYGHTMLVLHGVPARLEVRLAALLHDIAKPVTKTMDDEIAHFYEHEDVGAEMTRDILQRLRFGSDVVEHVAKAVKLHMRVNQYTSKWSNGSVRRLFLEAGDTINDLLDLAVADGASDRDEPREQVEARINELRERIQQMQAQAAQQPLESPLDGNELMDLFGKGPGSWLGPLKTYLNDLVIEGSLQSGDKEGAVVEAKAYMERTNTH